MCKRWELSWNQQLNPSNMNQQDTFFLAASSILSSVFTQSESCHLMIPLSRQVTWWVTASAAVSIPGSPSCVCHTLWCLLFTSLCKSAREEASHTWTARAERDHSGPAKYFPQMERFVGKCCWRRATLHAIWQARFPRAAEAAAAPSLDRNPRRLNPNLEIYY